MKRFQFIPCMVPFRNVFHREKLSIVSDVTLRTFLPTVFLMSLGSLLISCMGKGGTPMTPDQLLAAIQQGTAPVIVDVRTHSEYESGHVPGAQHLPFYAMWSRHLEIKEKPENPVVVYCEHGPRAWIGKYALWTLGYQNLVYLDGHMSGWKKRGLPMEVHSSPNNKNR